MLLVLASILTLYLLAMGWVYLGMTRLPHFMPNRAMDYQRFSIIIPFRNEAENLPNLLESLKNLRYDRFDFELLFIDDSSEDNSVPCIENALEGTGLVFRILKNQRFSQSPKKDAITLGVQEAKFKWIVTIDADCTVRPHWLRLTSSHIADKKSKMVCGPVLYETDDTLVKQFQFWDGLSLQAATQAGFGWNTPLLCNGANLAFEREVFFEVKGFKDNNHLASGDDIFLMEKINRYYPGQVHYLKHSEASVTTRPANSIKELIRQRIRWASKTSKSKNNGTKILGGIVFLGNVGFIVCLILCFILPMEASTYALMLLMKLLSDMLVLSTSACFFKKNRISPGLFSSNFSYPFVVLWVFLNSWNGHYEWKGRSFRK